MVLHVESVTKTLGDFSLHDISFDVKEGEYFAILGPTGAGKTIVLETIAGIYTPDTGQICWDGEDITHAEPRERNIGVVYQDYMLFPHMTVADNIGFGLRQRKMDRESIREFIKKTAGLLEIPHLLTRYPGTLSGGEQQRVALARALILQPRVLLLDEPMNALDTSMRERMRKELARIHRLTGTTVIQITHYFEEVFALADRVAIMNNGSIVQVGEPSEVFWHPRDAFVAEFLGIGNLMKGIAHRAGSLAEIELEGGATIVAVSETEGAVVATLHAEDVIISKVPFTSSARNCLPGTVTELVFSGSTIKIFIDVGFPLVALLTRESCRELGISQNSRVYATFKASAVHIILINGK